MPLIPFGSRYRPQSAIPPGLISPLEDDLNPAFNPRSLDVAPPPPIMPMETPAPNTPEAMPPIQQAIQHPKDIMPPPGMEAPEIAPQAPTPINKSIGAPPIDVELPPLETQAPNLAGPPKRPALGERPPSNADLALKDATQKLQQAQAAKPQLPKNNWAQRVATAVLAMTRFAPVTDDIVHPVWSQQSRQSNRDIDTAQDQFNTAKGQLEAEGLSEQREANASYKNAQAANANLADERSDAEREQHRLDTDQRIAGQRSTRNKEILLNQTKGRDSIYQKSTDRRPPSWEFIEDPDNPGMGFAVEPAWQAVTSEIAPYMPGVPVGELVSASEIREARKAANTANAAQAGRDAKPEAVGNAFQEAMKAWKKANPGKEPTADEVAGIQRKVERPNVTNVNIPGTEMNPKDRAVFNSITDKFRNSPLMKAADRTVVLGKTIDAVRKNPQDAAMQSALAYAYTQALDTYQSSVREGELKNLNAIDSRIGQLQNSIQQMQNGQIMRPEIAKQIADAAEMLRNAIGEGAKAKEQDFDSQAKQNGQAVHRAWQEYRQGAQAQPSAQGGNDMVDVQIPGQPPGKISRSQLDAFKKKYPNAVVK